MSGTSDNASSGALQAAKDRLEQLLTEAAGRLPSPFRTTGWYDDTGRMMGAIHFKVEPMSEVDGVFDCSAEFDRIESALRHEFGNQIGWPITIDVPAKFRGPHAVLKQEAERRDIETYSRVSRRDTNNG